MLIDTHCHLNFKAFNKDLKEVINAGETAGVGKIIIPGAKIDSSSKAIKIANIFPNCFAAVGIHPHHANSIDLNKIVEQFTLLVSNNKTVAVGEIGLDYHQYKDFPQLSSNDKNRQKELLLAQINIANEKNLPVIVHCRKAFPDLIEIISNKKFRGVFHCFSGKKQDLKKILGLGFYIGFDGNITYPENEFLRELVKLTPFERILLETDSPYLSPLPHRGERNTPSNLVEVARMIAKIQNLSVGKIEKITYSNAIKLFHL